MKKYKGKIQGLSVMLADLGCILISFFSVNYISQFLVNKNYFSEHIVINLLSTIILAYVIVFIFFNMNEDLMKRGRIEEFIYSVKINIFLMLVMTILLFATKSIVGLSRVGFAIALIVNVLLMFVVHTWIKKLIKRWGKNQQNTIFCYVVTTRDKASEIIRNLSTNIEYCRQIVGIAIIDDHLIGQEIEGVPVVAGFQDMLLFSKKVAIDEVYINVPYDTGNSLKPYILEFEKMGLNVHLNITMLEGFEDFYKEIRLLGPYPVISFGSRKFDDNKIFVKRCVDIFGALVGILITIVVGMVVAPILLLESSGPLIFKQQRVGKNGRLFYIYKFRSMYKDAEERKQALLEKNEMKGHMFKMADDPRITKVGKFIRKTSIDELPQFFNVLVGDMSLVGTRPPTVSEYQEYACNHKRRLSIKPGITGLWQVSGRNNVSDFEDVVKLDLEYIDKWSLALDIKILIKTVMVVFARKGSQ